MNVKGIVMDGGDGGGGAAGDIHWVAAKDEDNNCDSIISIGSIVSEEDSMNSSCSSYSSSSSELAEDASSSSTSSSSPHSNGPLYELSDLMNHLPIKRGLSMFYEGKAQSFSSLGRVQSIEDLPKNQMTRSCSYRKKIIMMKSCKSYGGGLDNTNSHRVSSYYSPKATISKKGGWSSKGSSKRSPSFLARPSVSVHKN